MLGSSASVHGARNLCMWTTDWTGGLKAKKKCELGHGRTWWESVSGSGTSYD